VLRRIFGFRREEVTGEWRTFGHKVEEVTGCRGEYLYLRGRK
jgi:hypothetical protein